MSKTIDNIDVVIAVCDLLSDIAKEAKLDIMIYPVVFPTSARPEEFLLVKDFPQHDIGNVDIRGAVEICIYRQNLEKEDDQSQPNLSRLKELTNIFLPKLTDKIKYSTAIVSITSRTVKHKEINSFYQSIICETISITNKSK